MNPFEEAIEVIGAAIKIGLALLVVSVPLAIWKLVDIAVWVYNHVRISA